MKKTILIGVLLSSVIFLLTPSIPAVQFTMVEDAYHTLLEDHLGTETLGRLQLLKKTNNKGLSASIQQMINTVIHNLNKGNIFDISLLSTEETSLPKEKFFPFLGIFVYLFIALVILQLISFVFQYIGGIVTGVITSIVQRITNLFSAIISLIMFIINVIITIVLWVVNALKKTGEILLNVIVLILSGILSTILVLISGIIGLLGFLWQGLGAILGVLLDIFRIIYEAIFPGAMRA